MKNRFIRMLNNPVPHPDLTDAIFNSVSEPELCLTVLKTLPEINQVTIATFFSGQGLKWSTKTGHRVRVFPVSVF